MESIYYKIPLKSSTEALLTSILSSTQENSKPLLRVSKKVSLITKHVINSWAKVKLEMPYDVDNDTNNE